MTNDDNDLEDLLLRWEEGFDAGKPDSIEDLCRSAPHLQERLAAGIAQIMAWKRPDSIPTHSSNRTPAISAEQFARLTVASGLLADEELRRVSEELESSGYPADASSLAAALIEQGRLTAFQANELLSGSNTPLALGDYMLLAKIGAGGMGQVYKAQHRHMDRLAAIKLLPATLTQDETAVRRFQREVKAAAKLSHPNIVQTHDASVRRGVWYLVMEYVEGSDLSATVRERGPLPLGDAVDYVQQAARGLAYAHGKGIVHRDIKPSNLLLDSEGNVKILDMGLARLDDSGQAADLQLTNTGQVMGTIDYMAPEQALDTRAADARSDIYSLGCTFFRLLTGTSVFAGDTVAKKLLSHVNDPAPSLRAFRPDVPLELDRIFQKMLAKKPTDRYQQAAELIAELEACRSERAAKRLDTSTENHAPNADERSSSPHRQGGGATPAVLTEVHPRTKTEQTMALAGAEIGTDPNSQVTASVSNPPVKQAAASQRQRIGPNKQPPWKNTRVLMGAALAGLLLLGIVVSVTTRDGTLIVEVEQPGATVQVLDEQGKVEVSQSGGGGKITIAVDAGKHRLKVEKDGFQFFTKDFEVGPGGKAEIKASLEPANAQDKSTRSKESWNTPAFQRWMKDVAAIPADEQVKAVAKRLQELNPRFDGQLRGHEGSEVPIIDNGVVLELKIIIEHVSDISPLRALPGLRVLRCTAPGAVSKLCDLSPLEGLRLQEFYCTNCEISDLSPLRGMPLKILNCGDTQVSNLSPLRGMKLAGFLCIGTPISDLSPLAGVPLLHLECQGTRVSDLTPLKGLPLTDLRISGTAVKNLAPLRGLPLTFLLMDGTEISDLSPLEGMALETFGCQATQVSDLSLLEKCMSLKYLHLRGSKVTAAGVAALKKALPNCKIEWDDSASTAMPQATSPALPPANAPFDATQARAHQEAWAKHLGMKVDTTNSIGMKLVLIPPGEFLMGSPETMPEDEEFQHPVQLTKPLLVGKYEVTLDQFQKFIKESGHRIEADELYGWNESLGSFTGPDERFNWEHPGWALYGKDHPVVNVNWHDAKAFCEWLSKKENTNYRLPTEAEWEFACRAGTTTRFYWGNEASEFTKHANIMDSRARLRKAFLTQPVAMANDTSEDDGFVHSAPVGSYSANPFGLYDVFGNVWEWCLDFYGPYVVKQVVDPRGTRTSPYGHRILRGGSWHLLLRFLGSADRHGVYEGQRSSELGFRVVRAVENPAN